MSQRNKRIDRQIGSVLSENDLKWETCTIQEVYPNNYTCDVTTDSGKPILGVPFPSLSVDPLGVAGDIVVPKRGQRYGLVLGKGDPRLVYSAAPPQLETPVTEQRVSYTDTGVGGLDSTYGNATAATFRHGLPPDVAPGDMIRIGTKGNLIGVLDSGISILKASELAKVIANSTGDLLQLVGRNMDILTDFGEIKFRNTDGRVSMSLKAGSQQVTETGAGADNFTIHADLGHAGELVDFKITDQSERILAQIHYHPDGSVTSICKNKDETVNGARDTRINGPDTLTVDGNVAATVSGNILESITGAKQTTVGTDIHTVAGSNHALGSGGTMAITAGQDLRVSAMGSVLAIPGDVAYSTIVTNGSLIIDVGNPTAGDLQKALSGVSVQTYLGNILLSSNAGKIALKTNVPNSVHLGGQLPIFHAMLYEMFESFMEAFGTAIDMHVHPAPGTSPPVTSPYKITKALMKAAKSRYVTFGG